MGRLLPVACRTLDAYTVEGAGDRGWFHTDRRSFGPGARTEMHASRPELLAPPPPGPARRVWMKRRSREALRKRHEAGGVVGPRRPEKRLKGLDSHAHRRRRRNAS